MVAVVAVIVAAAVAVAVTVAVVAQLLPPAVAVGAFAALAALAALAAAVPTFLSTGSVAVVLLPSSSDRAFASKLRQNTLLPL